MEFKKLDLRILFISIMFSCNIASAEEGNGVKQTFRDVFLSHTNNVSDKWDNYLEIYNEFYQKFVGKGANVLEIGVQNGGSLQIADKYFINGHIYGIDIDPKVCDLKLGGNIKTYCFDAKDSESIKTYLKDIKFDVISDDGSHINSDIIATFKIMFPRLNAGGVYLIEDLHTSYWEEKYEGGYLKKGTAVEFLKKFVDLVNLYHIREVNFMENLAEDDRYVFEWLESISFYDGVAVIKKLKQARSEPYKRVMTGKYKPITAPYEDLYTKAREKIDGLLKK